MDDRFFGKTGLRVSAACMGSMTFGREIGEDASFSILDAFAAAGGSFIDTADNIYSDGASEEIVGRWLSKQKRSDWVLATKCGFPTGPAPTDVGLTRKHIFDAIDASLVRLRTDYVDIYQVHWWDRATPIEETLSALNSLVQSGKVRYLGCSNFTAWQIQVALAASDKHGWARFESLQPMYSLVERHADLELLPLCNREKMAVIPYSPLARGVLSGKHKSDEVIVPVQNLGLGKTSDTDWNSLQHLVETERKQRIVESVKHIAESIRKTPAQVALAWVAAQPGVVSPILGARSVAQLNDNLGFLDVALSVQQLADLDNVSGQPSQYPHDYISWANGEYKRNR
jgi:aryl-alcohol dehydrogenase-like predicted oxidoreductase